VALGMMNLALVFTAALVIFAEKTLPKAIASHVLWAS
jgi:Sec-independent protein translocase protein TatA